MRQIASIMCKEMARELRFSNDGLLLFGQLSNLGVLAWDVATLQQRHLFKPIACSTLRTYALSPNTDSLVILSARYRSEPVESWSDSHLTIYDVSSGRVALSRLIENYRAYDATYGGWDAPFIIASGPDIGFDIFATPADPNPSDRIESFYGTWRITYCKHTNQLGAAG